MRQKSLANKLIILFSLSFLSYHHISVKLKATEMGLVMSIANAVSLAPALATTVQVLRYLHGVAAVPRPTNSASSTISPSAAADLAVKMDKQKVRVVQETLAFWIVLPLVRSAISWIPFGSLLGLYANVWLSWPVVASPTVPNAKITGIRLLLDDYLPVVMNYVDDKKMECIDIALKLRELPLISFTVNLFHLQYAFDYLKEIQKSQREEEEDTTTMNSWSVININNATSLLSSILSPIIDHQKIDSTAAATAAARELSLNKSSRPGSRSASGSNSPQNSANSVPHRVASNVSSKLKDASGSFDDFAFVTEKDFKQQQQQQQQQQDKLQPQNPELTPRKGASQIRKSSSSSFSSRFGFFS